MMEWLLQLDKNSFLFFNGLHCESLDAIMWWVSGKVTWWPFYLLLLGYFGWKKGWQLVVMILFIAITITLTDQTSVHLFKDLFHRLRPCHEPELEGLVHLVNNHCGGKYGFISSHAANSFGVAILTSCWIRRRWFAILMVLWALLVGYSRIYLGVHYPGDVLAGALWGAGCGWLVYRLFILTIRHLPGSWRITRSRTGPDAVPRS
jgi:undecaprenyl-diphosphatase